MAVDSEEGGGYLPSSSVVSGHGINNIAGVLIDSFALVRRGCQIPNYTAAKSYCVLQLYVSVLTI